MAGSKSDIRDALSLMASRTPWVTEGQHRAVEQAINEYFADDPEPVPGSELVLADPIQLAKVGDSTPASG